MLMELEKAVETFSMEMRTSYLARGIETNLMNIKTPNCFLQLGFFLVMTLVLRGGNHQTLPESNIALRFSCGVMPKYFLKQS